MGCDGGTIPKRDELVKTKKKPEAKDKVAELAFQWQCCAITQEKLEEPIVTCGLGRIYNKSSLIEALLNKSQYTDILQNIKSLKDVKDLKLSPNPVYNRNANKTDGMLDDRAVPYICPIIGLEMSGKFPFVCLWSCGCVMSDRAIKELKSNTCAKCQKPFTKKDIVILNASGEDLQKMQANTEERQAIMKANKKSKNKKIKEEPIEPIEEHYTPSITFVSEEGTDEKKPITSMLKPGTVIATTNSTVTSMSKPGSSNAAASLLSKHKLNCDSNTIMDPEIKKIKMGYSVAKDPKVTDVYKSLFTTHASEQKQDRAHWITYNPFYN